MIKKKKQGELIVVSAPSGAGKDTIVKKLVERNKNDYWISVSATSRKPRKGEKEGINYFYLTREEFEDKIEYLDIPSAKKKKLQELCQEIKKEENLEARDYLFKLLQKEID